MSEKSPLSKTLSGSLLIAGTTIGAGMLGIPLITGQSGFLPAALATGVVWIFMYLTGLLLLRATLWMPDHSSFLSLSRHFFGRAGEIVTGVMFVFLYYSLMIAYFAGGSQLFSDLLMRIGGISVVPVWSALLFSGLFFVIVGIGPRSIDRVNIVLSLVMFVIWFILIGCGAGQVEASRYEPMHWNRLWLAFPLLFGAFGFHNVIPSITSYLGRDVRVLKRSILIGTLIPLIVYLFWQWLIIGAIPAPMITSALEKGMPITFALESVTGAPKMAFWGQLFAFLAITTSVLGVSFSLVDFLADGFSIPAKGKHRFGLTALTILPPCLFSIVYPSIFEQALSIAGGFGEAVLNGILPIALVYVGRYSMKLTQYETIRGGRSLLLLLTIFSLMVICIECMHLSHLF